MMRAAFLAAVAALAVAVPAQAQNRSERPERSVTLQRQAVAAWTACIADEFGEDTATLLGLDYRTDAYDTLIDDMAQRRVSQRCFNAMPRNYRSIRLSGLPFAGGLAEHAIEAFDTPLRDRLTAASTGAEAQTFSYTDQVASCTVRGAPDLAARLFATEVETAEETAALQRLASVINYCAREGAAIEASPLAMRAMLATAAWRLLAANAVNSEESEPNA